MPERIEMIDKLPLGQSGEKIDKGALKNDIAKKVKAEGKI
jgi:non-ribosomal peptide synthetase component E (peptide arylation enzyme)